MSEDASGGGEKTHDPTPQKLEDARKRGEIAKSTDLSAAAAYFGLLIAIGVTGGSLVHGSGQLLSAFIARADTLAPRLLAEGGGAVSLGITLDAAVWLAPLFAVPFVLTLAVIFAQQALVFAPEKLKPKMNRISPIAQFKNKFGPTGLAEFAKATVKLVTISIVLGFFLLGETDRIIGLVLIPPSAAPGEIAALAVGLLTRIAIIALAIAAIDYVWQRYDHMRRNRMSFQEIKEEVKGSEGDPMVKAQRRRRAEEIANNRMMLDVPEAAVVIVNPTHYAVALKWRREEGGAPIVVAKGVDDVALRIRLAAERADVPIHEDPPTARALEATTQIGAEIEPAHYQAVAAAIRFADAMRRKAREQGLKHD